MSASDWISSVVAILTLGTVVFSAFSARSAAKSAAIAEKSTDYVLKQTKTMLKTFYYEITPLIVPRNSEIYSNNRLITRRLDSKDSLSNMDSSDIPILIRNVGKGNAFFIQPWVQLDNLNELLGNDKINDEKVHPFLEPYFLSISKKDNEDVSHLNVRQNNSDSYYNLSYRITNTTTTLDSLQNQGSYKFYIPPYIQILMLDEAATLGERHLDSKKNKYNFSLCIQFQTQDSLLIGQTFESKYRILIQPVSLKTSQNTPLRFNLIFEPIYMNREIKDKKTPLA